MSAIPLISHAGLDGPFAYRGGKAISARRFLRDVQALSRQLPDKRYILNLCADRYRFAVGFAAALCAGRPVCFPPITPRISWRAWRIAIPMSIA